MAAEEERELSVPLAERLIVTGVRDELEPRVSEVADRRVAAGVGLFDEIVGRETEGDAERLDRVFVRLVIDDAPLRLKVSVEGERRMITGDCPVMVGPVLVVDEGRRTALVDERGEDVGDEVFGRTMPGVERVMPGVERVLRMEELGVVDRGVTMLGVRLDDEED